MALFFGGPPLRWTEVENLSVCDKGLHAQIIQIHAEDVWTVLPGPVCVKIVRNFFIRQYPDNEQLLSLHVCDDQTFKNLSR